MKKIVTLLLFCTQVQAQIITEIMYNPPESGVDSLEYIEIYNNTNSEIDITGFSTFGKINISSSQTIRSIELYNALGHLIAKEKNGTLLPFESLNSGRYYAKVIYREGFELISIIKIR